MHGGRHLHGTQEAGGNGEPESHSGLLAWWQRRSWRMDLAVLARVRDGLKRLDEEPGSDDPVSHPQANTAHTVGVADVGAGAPSPGARAGTAAPPPAEPPAQDGGGGVLPDTAIT